MTIQSRQNLMWSPDEAARLRTIQLPSKIKCGRCHKNLNQASFSEKQLTNLRYQIDQGNTNASMKCRNCTGATIVELECMVCHKTKGLEEFAKSQRKSETARCFKCTEDQIKQKPVDEDKYETGKPFLPADHSGGRYPDYSQSNHSDPSARIDWDSVNGNGGMPSNRVDSSGGIALSQDPSTLSLNNTVVSNSNLIDMSNARGEGHHNSGISIGDMTNSWHTESTGHSSAVDARSYSHDAAKSRTGSGHSYSSSIAERSNASKNCSEVWEKTKAYAPPTVSQKSTASAVMQPMGDLKNQISTELELWGSDTDSESEDDDDDDDSDGENTVL